MQRVILLSAPLAVLALALPAACIPQTPPLPGYQNLDDKTNANAAYVGASACAQCHADQAAAFRLHGHGRVLTRIERAAPSFPAEAANAGVPDPPAGFAWPDIRYVVGGYRRIANFVDQDGYLLTTGETGAATQWGLPFAPGGIEPGFTEYEPDRVAPLPYDYSCFRCHTTGPAPFDANAPSFQDNRPGLAGAWHEGGVQCEACHGPGGGHFGTQAGQVVIRRERIFVDPDGAQTCKQCHAGPAGDASLILARDGFARSEQQANELAASGGHAAFACTICHDPHRSVTYDRATAIRNECRACHTDVTMAGHGGALFTRGAYSETLGCESCHMPYATLAGRKAPAGAVGPAARVGDTRTHIFRIAADAGGADAFLTDNGTHVRLDAQGRASVPTDYVCLRCHNGIGNVFELTPARAAEIAARIHELP
ncbi:MAG: cytochrome c family protein [Phycisphaerae bacterium]|nr:hypothetical protein [Phycisphaerae bacterium]MCZ2399355.1 cytochrome c family protein [Phycisphaerae bacterium]